MFYFLCFKILFQEGAPGLHQAAEWIHGIEEVNLGTALSPQRCKDPS